MSGLYLYDDEIARGFEPFALTRPLGEMRAGAMLIRERWQRALATPVTGHIVPAHLADFDEPGAPAAATGMVPAGSIVANSRCVVSLGAFNGARGDGDAWSCDGRPAAMRVSHDAPLDALGDLWTSQPASAAPPVEIAGRWLGAVWDLIGTLGDQLREDIAALGPSLESERYLDATVIGTHAIYCDPGATIEPHTVLDVTSGPILIRGGAIVRAFTRLVGPCVIDAGVTILGDRVSGCSIGAGSVIRGEISESIVLGHANKGHDGFVGHSYLGRWVNLGAGTITSNLKNTYDAVSLWTPEGMRDTTLVKLGTLFGDHVKTGIGTRLTTGAVVGAGSNIFGSAMPPKYVPPFSWGEGDALTEYRLDKFCETTERAMARRGVALSERARRQLAVAHARRTNAGSARA